MNSRQDPLFTGIKIHKAIAIKISRKKLAKKKVN